MTEKSAIKSRKYLNKDLKEKAIKVINNFNKKSSSEDGLKYLSESDIMDGTVAFKWSRSMNGYEYDRDFYMVVMDPADGELVMANNVCF